MSATLFETRTVAYDGGYSPLAHAALTSPSFQQPLPAVEDASSPLPSLEALLRATEAGEAAINRLLASFDAFGTKGGADCPANANAQIANKSAAAASATSDAAGGAEGVFSVWYIYDLLQLELSPEDAGIEGFPNASLRHLRKLLDYNATASRYSSVHSPSSIMHRRAQSVAVASAKAAAKKGVSGKDDAEEVLLAAASSSPPPELEATANGEGTDAAADTEKAGAPPPCEAEGDEEDSPLTPDEAIARLCEATAKRLTALAPRLKRLNVDDLTHSGLFGLLSAVVRGPQPNDAAEMIDKRIRAVLDQRRAALLEAVASGAGSSQCITAAAHSSNNGNNTHAGSTNTAHGGNTLHPPQQWGGGGVLGFGLARGMASEDLWRSFNSDAAAASHAALGAAVGTVVGLGAAHSGHTLQNPQQQQQRIAPPDQHYTQLVRLLEEKVATGRKALAALDGGAAEGAKESGDEQQGAWAEAPTPQPNLLAFNTLLGGGGRAASPPPAASADALSLSLSAHRRCSPRRALADALAASSHANDNDDADDNNGDEGATTHTTATQRNKYTNDADAPSSLLPIPSLSLGCGPGPLRASLFAASALNLISTTNNKAASPHSSSPVAAPLRNTIAHHLGQLGGACESFLKHHKGGPSRVASDAAKVAQYLADQTTKDGEAGRTYAASVATSAARGREVAAAMRESVAVIARERARLAALTAEHEAIAAAAAEAADADKQRRAKFAAVSKACAAYTASLSAIAGGSEGSTAAAKNKGDTTCTTPPSKNEDPPAGGDDPSAADAYVAIIRDCAVECTALLLRGLGASANSSPNLANKVSAGAEQPRSPRGAPNGGGLEAEKTRNEIRAASLSPRAPSGGCPREGAADGPETAPLRAAADPLRAGRGGGGGSGTIIFDLPMATAATSVALVNGRPLLGTSSTTGDDDASPSSKDAGAAARCVTFSAADVAHGMADDVGAHVFRRTILQDYHDALTALGFNLMAELRRLEAAVASPPPSQEAVGSTAEVGTAEVGGGGVVHIGLRGRSSWDSTGGSSAADAAAAEAVNADPASGGGGGGPSPAIPIGGVGALSLRLSTVGGLSHPQLIAGGSSSSPPTAALRAAGPTRSGSMSLRRHPSGANLPHLPATAVSAPFPPVVDSRAARELRDRVAAVEEEYRLLLAAAQRHGIALLNVTGRERQMARSSAATTSPIARLAAAVDGDTDTEGKHEKAAEEEVDEVAAALAGMLQPLLRERFDAFLAAAENEGAVLRPGASNGGGSAAALAAALNRTPLIVEDPDGALGVAVYRPRLGAAAAVVAGALAMSASASALSPTALSYNASMPPSGSVGGNACPTSGVVPAAANSGFTARAVALLGHRAASPDGAQWSISNSPRDTRAEDV